MGAYEQYLQYNGKNDSRSTKDDFAKELQEAIYNRNIKENLPILQPLVSPDRARGTIRKVENDVLKETTNKRQR